MSDWPVGLSTGCFYRTSIFHCLERIRESGFGLIEVCSFPAHLDYHDLGTVDRAAKLIESLGLEAYSLHAPFADDIDITAYDDRIRNHSRTELLRAADAAAHLGVRYLVIHPGPEKGGVPEEERFRRMENGARVLNEIADACRGRGVALVLENMLPHLFSGRVQELMWILGALKSTEVGICLDTGHAFLSGELTSVAHKLSGHLWMMHASDNRGERDDHLPPGEGDIDWRRLLGRIARSGFGGTIILEISGSGEAEPILKGARAARRYLRDIARQIDASG